MAVLDGAKGHTGDDYEDPELHVGEDWQSVKILPARPIKESEYAGNVQGLKSENRMPMLQYCRVTKDAGSELATLG